MSYYAPPTAPPAPPAPARKWWVAGWVLPTAAVLALLVGTGIGSSTAKTKTKEVAGPAHVVTVSGPTQTETVTATPTVVNVIKTVSVTHRVIYTPPVKVAFSDGTFRVNSELRPGTYHTNPPAGASCYWERENSGTGLDAIIANDNITGPTTIDISSGDYAFKAQGGCDWTRVG